MSITVLQADIKPGDIGKSSYRSPALICTGAGTLDSWVTANDPNTTSTGTLWDAASVAEAAASLASKATPIATLTANTLANAPLGVAFTAGLVVLPGANQKVSVAVIPTASTKFI